MFRGGRLIESYDPLVRHGETLANAQGRMHDRNVLDHLNILLQFSRSLSIKENSSLLTSKLLFQSYRLYFSANLG